MSTPTTAEPPDLPMNHPRLSVELSYDPETVADGELSADTAAAASRRARSRFRPLAATVAFPHTPDERPYRDYRQILPGPREA